MKMRRLILVMGLMVSACAARSRAVDLYLGNGSSAPESQGWLAYASDGTTTTHTTAGGLTTFDSTATQADKSGYSNYNLIFPVNPSFPTLDRTTGFTVSLDMQLLSESHANNDRSGVGLIALASDLQGIELEFWNNEVWVQSGSDFVHAEGHPFVTTAALTTYDLAIHGTTYEVFANGNSILTGNLRDYSAHGLPYTLPNFIFLGDDTTSAQGSFQFSRLTVTVPEPASMAGIVTLLLATRRRR